MKGLAGNEGADTDQHNKQTQDTSCLTTAKLLGGFFCGAFFFGGAVGGRMTGGVSQRYSLLS